MSNGVPGSILKHLMVWLGCVHITCGPLGFLQLIAWASMLATYSVEDGIARGITDTFSGDRPCAMCLKIADATPDHTRTPDAPLPTQNASSPAHPQPWQPPASIHLSPPPPRDLTHIRASFPADEILISALPAGPDTPPPRLPPHSA